MLDVPTLLEALHVHVTLNIQEIDSLYTFVVYKCTTVSCCFNVSTYH